MLRFLIHNGTMASLMLAIVFSAPATAQVAGGNEQLVNLVTQVQQLQDEVRSLRGQIEQQSYQIEELKRRQRDQYLDLDQRISELTGGQGAAGAAASVPSGPAIAPVDTPDDATPVEDAPEVRTPVDTPSTTTALGVPDTSSRETEASPEMEQAAYDEAFQALRELRYADAAKLFQSFLGSYPNSQYAGNAQYWLGESYYVTRNYDMALNAFEELGDKYPESTKSGDSLLKIGYTHYELKQYDQARAALEQVQEQYPDTTLARLAKNRLNSMRVEGHLQ